MTGSGDFQVQVQGATQLANVVWRELRHVQELDIKVHLRAGRMYDLFSLNQVIDILPVNSSRPEIETKGKVLHATAKATGHEVDILSEITADADARELKLKLTLRKTARSITKHQFWCEVRCKALDDHKGIALLLPARKRFDVLRPDDPSGQEIYDQDGPTFFPRTVRLSDQYGILASARDRKGILFGGSNVRYVSAFAKYHRLPDTRFFWVYGRDVVLDEGEEHTETFTFRLIDGLGGASLSTDDAVAGLGAMLDRRYVTDDKQVPVLFTASGKKASTCARVMRDDQTVLEQPGTGDLELDVSSLADGDYTVVKELDVGGKKLAMPEPLTILRQTYADFDRRAAAIEGFADKVKPDDAGDPQAARVRLELIRFKLKELAAYRRLHEAKMIDGLLKDAERAVKALKDNESAGMPKKGRLIYANDLSEDSDDFLIYGNVDMAFSKDKGMYLQPVGTVNMWTKFEVEGSFVVEFDYYPYRSEKGGTMLQLCGRHPNPISQYDFMCSASYGSMAYYMFGVRCYHYSFSRWGGLTVRPERICNFRKTGKGFYVLSRIPDPIPEVERWYHLAFVKDRNHFLFFVDGVLAQEYFDEGHQGPILDGGHIGIRNWSTYRSHFRDFKVHAIESQPK